MEHILKWMIWGGHHFRKPALGFPKTYKMSREHDDTQLDVQDEQFSHDDTPIRNQMLGGFSLNFQTNSPYETLHPITSLYLPMIPHMFVGRLYITSMPFIYH